MTTFLYIRKTMLQTNKINVLVMSRDAASRYTFSDECNSDCVIVSITDVGSQPNKFNRKNKHIKGILRLQFNDVCFRQPYCIQIRDAKKILKFVCKHIKKVKTIVIHCEEGISRSAGIAAAISTILCGHCEDIASNPKYRPNQSCYFTVLATYYSFFDSRKY